MVVRLSSMETNLQNHTVPIHGNNHNMINHDIQNNDNQKQQHQHHQVHNQLPLSEHYNVSIRFDPITPEAGKPTELLLSITAMMKILHLLSRIHFQNLVNTSYGSTSNQKEEIKLLQHLSLMLLGSPFIGLKNLYMMGSIPKTLWTVNIKLV